MAIDASPILAILFDEPTADWVTRRLVGHTAALVMSTVNLTEVLIRMQDRRHLDPAAVLERLTHLGVRLISPDVEQAKVAAAARLRFPINLGDCFAYALARGGRLPDPHA